MPLHTWLLYAAAVLVLTITPGPTVLMCIATAVQWGPRKAAVAVAGSTSAIVGLMALSALGLGAALAASETLFNGLKWLGVAYLAYLGVSALRSAGSLLGPESLEGQQGSNSQTNQTNQTSQGHQGHPIGSNSSPNPAASGAPNPAFAGAAPRRLFMQGFLVGASNPKALLFFGALFPQFIDPALPQGPQFAVWVATFVFFEVLWLTVYALSAARAQHWLREPRRARWFQRATGVVFLVAAGALTLQKR